MSQPKDFFSSKPKQIAKAIVKISHQIFGKISNVEIAIIGDEEMVEDISENLKKFSFKNFNFFHKPIDFFFDEELKKIKNEVKFLNNYKKSDIFLIGFKKGEKVFSKELIKKLLTRLGSILPSLRIFNELLFISSKKLKVFNFKSSIFLPKKII